MNELKSREIGKNDEIIFYYEGIGVTAPSVEAAIGMEKTGHDMILDDLKAEKMIDDIKKEYKEELDRFVHVFKLKFQGGPPNSDDIQFVISQIPNLDMNKFFVIWSTTICALLKLKVIENDNYNGYAVVPKGTVTVLNRQVEDLKRKREGGESGEI